jgi:hypothetical protein
MKQAKGYMCVCTYWGVDRAVKEGLWGSDI